VKLRRGAAGNKEVCYTFICLRASPISGASAGGPLLSVKRRTGHDDGPISVSRRNPQARRPHHLPWPWTGDHLPGVAGADAQPLAGDHNDAVFGYLSLDADRAGADAGNAAAAIRSATEPSDPRRGSGSDTVHPHRAHQAGRGATRIVLVTGPAVCVTTIRRSTDCGISVHL
jgi:hypothetical protein